MDSIKSHSSSSTKSKFTKSFFKVIHLKTPTKTLTNNPFCLLIPQEKTKNGDQKLKKNDEVKSKNRAAMEAFVAKLFATISTIKASYAELQMAQFPKYNGEAIQLADQGVVDELRKLSELKQRFLKKQVDSSPPHVTLLLTEIQEQQSLMKMYEITIKKMEAEIEAKKHKLLNLQGELKDTMLKNKSLEKKLNSSGCFSILENINLSASNPKDFILVLQYATRSVRSFVKLLVQEMESSSWNIDVAVDSIHPNLSFSNKNHKCFVFESFVCQEMFQGFENPTFSLQNDQSCDSFVPYHIDQFKKLKSVNSVSFLKTHPNSSFAKFTRSKYLRLVHPKMEASFYGNLKQRKMINAWEFPETPFFESFAEMARRVWILHCLALSFGNGKELSVFQAGKKCRFSEVYMESVVSNESSSAGDRGFTVAFTVVPGFKIGKTVVQSQVFLSPAKC